MKKVRNKNRRPEILDNDNEGITLWKVSRPPESDH